MNKQNLSILFLLFFSISAFSYNYFSPIIKTENLNSENLNLKLKHTNLIINSEEVYKDLILLKRNQDYKIDYHKGEITFISAIGYVAIEYLIFPPDLLREFFLFQVQEYSDTTKIKIPKKQQKQFYSETNLNITGSKTFSISVANNEDFSLNQSLFLRINGELSRNLRIEAQLTDSQSPITPEGDSREISSLDQIFIRLYGKNYELAFGDLEMKFENTQFINFSPKFEGLKAGWFGQNEFQGAMTISKGKTTTTDFKGLEGKQGPYYLSTEIAEGVQVIPGSENVYLNGIKMQRGDDYTIDYSEGSITFTNKYFITSNSHILVNFQYSDEDYRQNMYLTSSSINLTNKFKINHHFIIQNDDKENPLRESFSESDKEILKNAGDGIAWGNGIFEVEQGEGLYIKITEEDEIYYEYVGPDSIGNFNLYFSYVGEEGSYEKSEDGNYYVFVGENLGLYLPQRKLSSPENKANYDLSFQYSGNFFKIQTEGLFSVYDKNTFSKKDDADNKGLAAQIGLDIYPDYDRVKPDIKVHFRKLSKDISTFADLQNPLENYELIAFPDTLDSEEFSSQVKMDFLNFYQPNIKYQRKIVKNYATQNYFSFTSNLKQKWILPKIYHRYLFWNQDFENEAVSFFRNKNLNQHDIKGNYVIKKIKLGSGYFIKELKEEAHDFAKYGERIRKWDFHISTYKTKNLSAEISYKEENNDSLQVSQNWESVQTSKTVGFKTLLNSKNHKANIDFSHREINGVEENKFDMAKITLSNSLLKDAISLNSNYSLKNVQFYPKIRTFEFVGENSGFYDEDSVYTEGGGYDWVITDIDYEHPEMSVEVNANFILFLTPKNISNSILKKFQTETNWMISENSKSSEKWNIYLLNPDILMDAESTIFGRNSFRQTIWFDVIHRKLLSKLKFQQDKTLDNRYQDSITNRLQIIEGNLQFSGLRNMKFDLFLENRKEEDSRYESEIEINSVEFDIRNKINDNLTLQTDFDFSYEKGNKQNEDNYEIQSYKLSETITYFFQRKYRLFSRFSYKRNNRSGSTFLSFLADKKDGDIFKWNINLDYKIGSYTSVRLKYSGDSYPEQDDVHQLEVEVKAEF